jgi:hypothetical protein
MPDVKTFLCGCVLATVLLPSVSAAQNWDEPWSDPRDRPTRLDLSVSAGMLAPTDWSDLVLLGTLSSATGVLEQVIVRDVRVDPSSLFGGAVTYWRDRYGFRVQAELSRSSLMIGGDSLDGQGSGPDFAAADVNSWLYDVRGAVGFLPYSPGRNVWPYAFLGFGGITYDVQPTLTPPLLTFVERGRTRPDGSGGIIIIDDDGREFLLAVDELALESEFAFSFGVGTDLRLPFGGGGVGLRLEVSDHMSGSPLSVRIRELGSSGGLGGDDVVEFGTVHHLRAAVGLVLQIGR